MSVNLIAAGGVTALKAPAAGYHLTGPLASLLYITLVGQE